MKQSGTTQPRFGRGIARAASLVLALLFVSSFLTPVFAQYKRTDLVSNQPGVAPTTDEQHLVNAWGLTALPRSPFWVSDNGTGFSTLYTGAGQQIPLFVTIAPAPSSQPGTLGTPGRHRRKHQPERDRLYSHGERQVRPISLHFRDVGRYDQRLESRS